MTFAVHGGRNDDWLTPQPLWAELGPFDFDPCCRPVMPWRTAATMLALGRPLTPAQELSLALAPPPRGVVPLHSPGCPARLPIGAACVGCPTAAPGWQRSELRDGLGAEWRGRVCLNFPYSLGGPWVDRMIGHGRGVTLASAKSMDSRWGQLLLGAAALALFLKGRLLFHYPNGRRSAGKWLSNVLVAHSEEDALKLAAIRTQWPGVALQRVK